MIGCSSRYPGPKSPQETIETFQISDDFRVEIFAAEPHVVEPVDLAFDARGRIFVVEMRDFPYETAPQEGQSRIRLLEDTDGDNQIDHSAIFADSLSEATSVLPWNDGLLVTAAPNILYLKDTDGDGRADLRRVLFTGFFTGNLEAQITNLRFGVDNWIYASNAGNAGDITFTGRPDVPPVSVRGGDFRFRLDRGRFERAAGHGRFGQDFDVWGHRFLTHSTVHVRSVVLPEPYLSRNPFLEVGGTENISVHSRRMFQLTSPPYWRAMRTKRRNERYDEKGLDRTEHASGYFTGATGGTIYTGTTFPETYHENLFTADIAGSLVHRDILHSTGVTFTASRAEEEQERAFLASTDPWFRPANLRVGPDGNLYVLDMYRLHVETPMSIPADLEEDMDYSKGNRHGRIYRVIPRGNSALIRGSRDLRKMASSELAELLSHENRWWRLAAQRLILERQDQTIARQLEELTQSHAMPQARLHALYALEGLSLLSSELVVQMLEDPHPGVREHAVRLAERHESLADEVAGMVDDPSARVAFQVGLSLGEFSDAQAEAALVELAQRRGEDEWIQTAILSSSVGSSVEMLQRLADSEFFDASREARKQFLQRASKVIASRGSRSEIERMLKMLNESRATDGEEWQTAGLAGLAEGLAAANENQTVTLTRADDLRALLNSSFDTVRVAAQNVADHVTLK